MGGRLKCWKDFRLYPSFLQKVDWKVSGPSLRDVRAIFLGNCSFLCYFSWCLALDKLGSELALVLFLCVLSLVTKNIDEHKLVKCHFRESRFGDYSKNINEKPFHVYLFSWLLLCDYYNHHITSWVAFRNIIWL